MKQIAILVIVLLIIIGAGIWEMSYLKESSTYFLTDINNTYQIAERKDYELAKNEAEKLQEVWKDIRKIWAIFIDDSQMDDVGDRLVSFVSYIETENEEEIKHSYNILYSAVRNVVEFECLKAENIF